MRRRRGERRRKYLAGTVCTAAADTGDTSDGTAGTPGLCGGLVAGLFADGVGLALVLCDALWGAVSGTDWECARD